VTRDVQWRTWCIHTYYPAVRILPAHCACGKAKELDDRRLLGTRRKAMYAADLTPGKTASCCLRSPAWETPMRMVATLAIQQALTTEAPTRKPRQQTWGAHFFAWHDSCDLA